MSQEHANAVVRTAGFAAKAAACGAVYVLGAGIGGALATRSGVPLPPIPQGVDERTLGLLMAAAGPLVGVALGLVAVHMAGNLWKRWLALSALTYVFAVLNAVIEGAFFTRAGGAPGALVVLLPSCVLAGAAAALLFRPRVAGRDAAPAAGRWPAPHRLVPAWLAFPAVYVAFGLCVAPFVSPIYEQGQYGLVRPAFGTVVAVQAARGALFLLACLPVIIMWKGTRAQLAARLGLAMFLLVGLLPMAFAAWLPLWLRGVHTVEMLAGSLVYAGALAMLLRPRARAAGARLPGAQMIPADQEAG